MNRERPTRVLLVDDQPTLVWGLASLIAADSSSMEVAGISFGARLALALAVSQNPDVILLGAGVAGDGLLDFVAQLAARSRARIIVMDTSESAELRARAREHGVSDVVSKMQPASGILDAIARVGARRADTT